MAKLRLVLLGLSVLPGFVGCASVLGIETATHDPQLDTAGSGNKGGSGNGGSAGAGGAVDVPDGGDLCSTYCDTVMANCPAPAQQYVSKAVCMKICARLDPGQPGDDSGNTINCRLHYAESAATAGEVADNCSAAGPGGAQQGVTTVCGSYCEGLCRIALDTCKGAERVFNSVSECVSSCAGIPDLGDYNDTITDGNSVQCRLYHVSAAQIDPVIHCPHVTGLVGPCKVP
jgi:hypothetical protein